MKNIIERIDEIDWQNVTDQMHKKGYVIVPDFLSEIHCKNLIEMYSSIDTFRKIVVMERYL